MAFVLLSSRIPSADTPVVGVTLEPYSLVKRADTNTTANAEDVPEEGTGESRYSLRFRWYRSVVHRGGAVCWIHPDREATIQCIICSRFTTDKRKSYHCSTDCLKQNWGLHKDLHNQKRLNGHIDNGYVTDSNFKASQTHTQSNGGETWIEVGKSRLYTPSIEDTYTILRCEVVAIDSHLPYKEVGKTISTSTARVRPAPSPPKRAIVPLPQPRVTVAGGKFTALTYNVLADLYANAEHFLCQPWMLAWGYRKQNLLKELIGYNADILCLQEVQSNHFADFLQPELQKHGYTAIYKKKTTELYTGSAYAIDGCATFFRRDRFALVKKYEVEFNKAALSLAESLPSEQKKQALNRLLKDNVALIAVLEALDPPNADAAANSRRQLICVANTHIHANPELNDVKLWQVHTLLKGLEKIAASADIPMLVAGDFNSEPGSAAHQLLVKQAVDPNHKELKNDPLKILRPSNKMHHNLPLASVYAAVLDGRPVDVEAQKQRRRMDPLHKEPKFTNWGKDFKGTLDYILYTTESLVPTAALELPDEAEISRQGQGLPNEHWSSDHIALLAEFQYVQS